jgi:hypothetical protein
MKRVAITQSNYIPWKGYFDLIASVDEVIIYDDMQYTRRDWRNRNKIKTPHGHQWLTVPVISKGKYHQAIRDTEISGNAWASSHWKALELNYRRAPFFEEISTWLEPLYRNEEFENLSIMNRCFIKRICEYLNIQTLFTCSWEYDLLPGKTERLAHLCKQAGGDHYISGPAAKAYIDEGVFKEKRIELVWYDYQDYPEYPQLWGEFVHDVSILDLLFNCGRSSSQYMRHVK